MVAVRLTAVLLAGCIRVLPPSSPVMVEVTKQPMPAVVYCDVGKAPVPPPELRLNHKIEDVVDRTMVHYRDYNLLIGWTMHLHAWGERVQQCFERLTMKPMPSPPAPLVQTQRVP